MFNLSSKRFIFFIIILLSSPAFSITGLFNLGFFPNEKLAILLVAISKSAWREEFKQLRLIGFIISFILGCLFCIQIITGTSGIIQASINSIFIIASIPLYCSFLSARPNLTLQLIFFVGILQLIISLFQQYHSFSGNYDTAFIFNNYPPQQGVYDYMVAETGFWYRTAGLFFESSGYGLFQWLAIICALQINIHKTLFGKIILFILILEVILNGALTGYLFAFGFFVTKFLIKFKNRKNLIKALFNFPVILILFYLIQASNYYDFSGLTNKVIGQFDFLYNDNSYKVSRIRGMFESIQGSLGSDYVMFGAGFSWLNPTLDFYSLYIRAYGVAGFFCLVLFIFSILKKAPLYYGAAVFLALSVNGHLSTSINIIILSMSFVFYKIQQSTINNEELKK